METYRYEHKRRFNPPWSGISLDLREKLGDFTQRVVGSICFISAAAAQHALHDDKQDSYETTIYMHIFALIDIQCHHY